MIKKYLIVRGRRRWAITLDGVYTIYSVFESCSDQDQLEEEMVEYAKKQFITQDGFAPTENVITYYRDLSFLGTPSLVGTAEFVVQRGLGGVWYGFIPEDSINKLFAASHKAI